MLGLFETLICEDACVPIWTAKTLTQKMKEVFPEDPCRADFALFGLGVES